MLNRKENKIKKESIKELQFETKYASLLDGLIKPEDIISDDKFIMTLMLKVKKENDQKAKEVFFDLVDYVNENDTEMNLIKCIIDEEYSGFDIIVTLSARGNQGLREELISSLKYFSKLISERNTVNANKKE